MVVVVGGGAVVVFWKEVRGVGGGGYGERGAVGHGGCVGG